MKQIYLYTSALALLFALTLIAFIQAYNDNNITMENDKKIELPEDLVKEENSLEEVISKRRSVRNYDEEALEIRDLSQILWAAQGLTDSDLGLRATPSAGALYPLSVYVAVENVIGLKEGIYRYSVEDHSLNLMKEGGFGDRLHESAMGQSAVKDSSFVIIISADYDITRRKYKERAERYVHMEAGHAGQNIYLQTTALDLGTVAIGAFDDNEVSEVLGLEKETPLYLFPVGKKP
ncbi:MAG: SagB/ThcOx family dehydrogenase [Patescibacteria group bacterium]